MPHSFTKLSCLAIIFTLVVTIEADCGARLKPSDPYRQPTHGSQCSAKVKAPPTRCLSDVAQDLFPVSITEVIDRHNCWREQVNPPASTPLKPLKWDDELAQIAERWAAQCRTDGTNVPPLGTIGTPHDNKESRTLPNRTTGDDSWDWVGQNIYMSSSSMALSDAIDGWAKEQEDFKYGVGSINGNKVGHYTQVVAARSFYVGCGKAYCPKLDMPYLLVCNYGPGGNVVEDGGVDGTIKPYPSSGVMASTTTSVPTTRAPQNGGKIRPYSTDPCKKDADCLGTVGLKICSIAKKNESNDSADSGVCICCKDDCIFYSSAVCIKEIPCKEDSECASDEFCCPNQHLCFPLDVDSGAGRNNLKTKVISWFAVIMISLCNNVL